MDKVRQEHEAEWLTVLTPRKDWSVGSLKELWHYRDLVMLFVRRDFVAVYKQTILGPLWFLLQPLLTTIVFTVIFGHIAQLSTEGVPQVLFYLSGIIIWNYFANCLGATSNTFVGNASMFGKVYFPRLVVPLSIVISNLMAFGIQFLLFLGFYCYFFSTSNLVKPNYLVVLLPLLVFQAAMLSLGCGIIVSSLTTKYRDLTYLVSFGIQLWMFISPVVYPTSQVPEGWQWLLFLNPVASLIETFRYAFVGVGSFNPWQAGYSVGVTVIILIIGIVLFSRIEKNFMDTV